VTKLYVLSCAALMYSAGIANAFPTFVGHIRFFDSYGSTGGGEFRAEPEPDFSFVPGATGTPFQFGFAAMGSKFEPFCVEKFEHLDFDVSYEADLNIVTTAQASAYASGNHGGFNDPLDPRSAYLFHNFINHTLATPYDYVNEGPRIDDADAMQTAIWFIEDEDTTPLLGKALAFYNEANAAVASGAWTGLGDVRILNIYTNTARVDYQDVLVVVPAPAGVAGLAIGLLAAARRRR
jgi:hypothetical protein